MTILTVLPVLLLLVAGAGGFDLGRKTGLQVDNTASAPLNRPYFCPPHVWCPRFEILNSTSGYETRQYSNGVCFHFFMIYLFLAIYVR